VKSDSGIIVVELLLAVAIVGIAAVAVLEILTSSVAAGRNTENLQRATSLCRERLEQIRNISGLSQGTGSNSGDPFLPDLTDVSVDSYFSGFYLTESDTYQISDGTPGSLAGMNPPSRIDRITRIEWVDDPDGGTARDYYRITVSVFWREGPNIRSFSLETLMTAD